MGREAAKVLRSASTASIWLIADFVPSTIPIFTSSSIASRLGKYVTLLKREPCFVAVKVKTIRIEGIASLRLPSGLEKPSSTSKRLPGSTVRKRNQPLER